MWVTGVSCGQEHLYLWGWFWMFGHRLPPCGSYKVSWAWVTCRFCTMLWFCIDCNFTEWSSFIWFKYNVKVFLLIRFHTLFIKVRNLHFSTFKIWLLVLSSLCPSFFLCWFSSFLAVILFSHSLLSFFVSFLCVSIYVLFLIYLCLSAFLSTAVCLPCVLSSYLPYLTHFSIPWALFTFFFHSLLSFSHLPLPLFPCNLLQFSVFPPLLPSFLFSYMFHFPFSFLSFSFLV